MIQFEGLFKNPFEIVPQQNPSSFVSKPLSLENNKIALIVDTNVLLK